MDEYVTNMSILLICTYIFNSFTSAAGANAQTIAIPLVDKSGAPLTAEFDTTEFNQQIKAMIDRVVIDMQAKLDQKQKETDEVLQHLRSELTRTRQSCVDAVQNTSIRLQNDISRLKIKVSFSARLGTSIEDISPDATVIFDNVVSNNGGYYNPANGIFTAPVDGTYFFTSSILTKDPSIVEMELLVNGINKMHFYASSKNLSYNNAVNSVIVDLQIGNKVKIAKHGIFGSRPFYIHQTWSTFSGFLISIS